MKFLLVLAWVAAAFLVGAVAYAFGWWAYLAAVVLMGLAFREWRRRRARP
jgi:hypothetical protein